MIGDKIRERRLELGMTQSQVAELTKIKKNTISNYENNVSAPNENNIFKLMEVLKCDANYLFEWEKVTDLELSIKEKNHIKKYRTLDEYGKEAVDKILDVEYNRCANNETSETNTIELPFSLLKASAGTGEWLDEEQLDKITVTDTPTARKADIVIEVDGDSMIPVFNDGDKVLVRLQPAVEIGEIGIFIIDNMGYIKKYANDRLISLNPDYNDIYPNEYTPTKCIGKVIGKI